MNPVRDRNYMVHFRPANFIAYKIFLVSKIYGKYFMRPNDL